MRTEQKNQKDVKREAQKGSITNEDENARVSKVNLFVMSFKFDFFSKI